MDQQPKYNRILNYKPESNRAIREIGPDQYAACGVLNAAKLGGKDPYLPEYLHLRHGTWHSGRSIRINRMGDQGPPITASDSRGVYHRNCMWFDVEIDKQYLLDNNITHLDTILRGNISDNMIYSSIWWPLNEGLPDFSGPNTVIGPDRPVNPLPPCREDYPNVECGPTIWVETANLPGEPPAGTGQDEVPLRIWSYTKEVGFIDRPGEDNDEILYDWEIIFGSEASQGLYNTTTINNIPTYVSNPDLECRFVVQVHWNMKLSNTVTPREVALYVFNGSMDATRNLDDYIVKSPIVRMRNQANPGPPAFDEPTQKGFVPAERFDYYDNPIGKNLSIPITDTEIVMDVLSGTATVDPNDEYEDAVFIDLVGDNAKLVLHVGAGSQAWVMAPVDDGVYQGNFPYYIGDGEQYFDDVTGIEYRYIPISDAEIHTFEGPGRYAIYGPNAIIPSTAEIAQWLEDNNFPPADTQLLGVLKNVKFENSLGFSNITNWEGIIQTTGQRLFANTTGDVYLPEYQSISNLTQIFAGNPDFTDSADALQTWITQTATNMNESFADCVNYNKNPGFATSNITSMRETFRGCINFNANIESWDVSRVTDMFGMFKGCANFDQPLGEWDTSTVRNMGDMFAGCSVYDQFIATWDVSEIQSKPPGFDTGTTPEWEDFEKPWWGADQRPNTQTYVTLDIQNANLQLKYQGYTRLQVFRFDTLPVATINQNSGSGRRLLNVAQPVALFGVTDALGFSNRSIRDYVINTGSNTQCHTTQRHVYTGGYGVAVGLPFDQSEDESYISPEVIQSEIDRHIDLDTGVLNNILDRVRNNQVLGDNNNWDDLYTICSGLTSGAFEYLGRLPADLPADLRFGWDGMTISDRTNLMQLAFAGCGNIPPEDLTQNWTYEINPDEISLFGSFMFMPDSTNMGPIISRILAATQTADAEMCHNGSVLKGIDIVRGLTTQITSLEKAYRYADLTDTQGENHIANINHENCLSWHQAFMFATGTNTFVETYRQDMTAPGVDLSYEFAGATTRPNEITDWDFTVVDNISKMFYNSVFPDRFENVDLSNMYQNELHQLNGYNWQDFANENIRYVVYDKSEHVFTGCSGSAMAMANWKLPHPQAIKHNNKVIFRDVLIPWWFAGCRDFNCDLSSWQTTDPVTEWTGVISDPEDRKNYVSTVRIGTFALCENFNSAIPWYYPEEYYFPLATDFTADNATPYDSYLTAYAAQINSESPKLFDTQMYGEMAPTQLWWRTFLGATSYNNGGEAIPTIMASDMVDTFRNSGIDQDLKIRKPCWGKGYYQGVFEDTTAWSQKRVIDFECQNRSDTPELENVYYHVILAQRMFKNSTYQGDLGPGFKWFWFNVSNVNGCHYYNKGMNKEFTNWESYAELQDLRVRDENNTLSEIVTGSVTDTYGTKEKYNDNVLRSTYYGPNRAPQGNIIDAESEYAQIDTDNPDSLTGYGSDQTNSGLVDMTLPPVYERIMSNYAVFPLWTQSFNNGKPVKIFNIYDGRKWFDPGNGPTFAMRDTQYYGRRSKYGYYTHREGRTPVEMTNLSEMFAGATQFDQDLSMFRTRWSPPSGAFTQTSNQDWREPDSYFGGGGQEKPEATFGRRSDNRVLISYDPDATLLPGPAFAPTGRFKFNFWEPNNNYQNSFGTYVRPHELPTGYVATQPEYDVFRRRWNTNPYVAFMTSDTEIWMFNDINKLYADPDYDLFWQRDPYTTTVYINNQNYYCSNFPDIPKWDYDNPVDGFSDLELRVNINSVDVKFKTGWTDNYRVKSEILSGTIPGSQPLEMRFTKSLGQRIYDIQQDQLPTGLVDPNIIRDPNRYGILIYTNSWDNPYQYRWIVFWNSLFDAEEYGRYLYDVYPNQPFDWSNDPRSAQTITAEERLMDWEMEKYEVVPGIRKGFAIDTDIPFSAMNITAQEYPAAIYRSTTQNNWFVAVNQGGGFNPYVGYRIIHNPHDDLSTLLTGDSTIGTAGPRVDDEFADIYGSGQPWREINLPGADGIDPVKSVSCVIQNGHRYNNWGDSKRSLSVGEFPANESPGTKLNSGPEKSEMDVVYLDNQAYSTNTLPNQPITGTEMSLYHGYKHTPNKFAEGASNFTPDKWPTWMVAYTEEPQSVADINNHFDDQTDRNTGDSRLITNYAWTHEPYNWPDGDIYRNGEY